MRFANELKVGLALVVSVAIFVLGIRFLKDVPLVGGNASYYSVIHDANGLIAGNPVRVNGVKVGSVTGVEYDPAIDSIRVDFKIDRRIQVPAGSNTRVAGIDALGGVRFDLALGHRQNPPLPGGARVTAADKTGDLLGELTRRAPHLANQTDSVLTNLSTTLSATADMLDNPGSDLRRTLAALRGTAGAVEATIRSESDNLSQILANLEGITASVKTAVGSDDSLAIAAANLRDSMASLKDMMATLEQTMTRLDGITAKMDSGEGTLGLLLNDPGLYTQLDSAARSLNALLADFKANPRRYLRELKLVDIL